MLEPSACQVPISCDGQPMPDWAGGAGWAPCAVGTAWMSFAQCFRGMLPARELIAANTSSAFQHSSSQSAHKVRAQQDHEQNNRNRHRNSDGTERTPQHVL